MKEADAFSHEEIGPVLLAHEAMVQAELQNKKVQLEEAESRRQEEEREQLMDEEEHVDEEMLSFVEAENFLANLCDESDFFTTSTTTTSSLSHLIANNNDNGNNDNSDND